MAPGAGFEPARGRINSAVPFQLGYPGRTLVGNLGVEPSDLCVPGAADFRLPRSRTSTFQELVGPSGLEPESQASETCALSRWAMDRRLGKLSAADNADEHRLKNRSAICVVLKTPCNPLIFQGGCLRRFHPLGWPVRRPYEVHPRLSAANSGFSVASFFGVAGGN